MLVCNCCGLFPCGITQAINDVNIKKKEKLDKKVMEEFMKYEDINLEDDFDLPKSKTELSEGVTVMTEDDLKQMAEPEETKIILGTNPKDLLGTKKVSLSKVPFSSIVYQALAMEDGAKKYGPFNWRENKVIASIYIDAAMRHLGSWYDGEEVADDSKKPHLGHAMACIGIIIDALETGNLVDDRPLPGNMSALIEKWKK